MQRVESIAEPHAMGGVTIIRILRFEGLDFSAQYIPTGIDDPRNGRIEFRPKLAIRGGQVEKLYRHAARPTARMNSL